MLGCVEPCQVVQVRGNKETKKPELRIEPGKCLHYYHYYLDADYGLRYTRLQSWFPFTMHVGLNGRDWLARQMTKAGLGYRQKDNCFTWVEDWEAAQRLLDEQLTTEWAPLLDGWAAESHPWLSRLVAPPVPYYWSVQEGEYATDIAFRTPEDLRRLYPRLVQYATGPLQSTDLLRFFGYRVTKSGQAPSRFRRRGGDDDQGVGGRDVRQASGAAERAEDVRQVRAGAAAGEPADQRPRLQGVSDARRRTDGPMEYLRLRKGVADMHRRAELGEKINERYAEALATVEDTTPLGELARDLGKPTTWKGRSVRALNPLAPADVELLEAINRGEFVLNGFRNRDLRALLFADRRIGEPRGSQEASGQGDAVASSASCPWRDHQGPQDPPLPGVGGRPQQGDRVAGGTSGQHRTIAQSRMR